jgi:hypothetical protein
MGNRRPRARIIATGFSSEHAAALTNNGKQAVNGQILGQKTSD